MSAPARRSQCVHPESLVLVEVLPLCRVSASDEPWLDDPAYLPEPAERGENNDWPGVFGEGVQPVPTPLSERPLRCAAVMGCAEAFALMEEVGHVAW